MILENIILIHLPTLPMYMILQTRTFTANLFQTIGVIFLLILIYFLHTPLHELAFYSLNYPFYLFPSYLNHAFVYFNQISATTYLSYVSSTCYRVYKLKLVHKLTTKHTLHSKVKLPIAQILDCCFA